jgi:hypothetical protein
MNICREKQNKKSCVVSNSPPLAILGVKLTLDPIAITIAKG